ncbi:MAG: hypothetical protein AABX97_10180 [Candidatus Thermoplasmatota archaeon]
MAAEAVSAPYVGFLQGPCRIRGYCLQDEGNRLSLAFEPWFVESEEPCAVPCLPLELRKREDRIVLERFVVCDAGQETCVDLEAAHDAMQI